MLNNNKLNEDEKTQEYYQKSYETFLSKLNDLISILQKYISKFEHESDYKETAEYLKKNMIYLQMGYERKKREGLEGFNKSLKRNKNGDRVGFGFRRGLIEYMYPGPGEEDNWIREILDVARDLDKYWENI